MYKRILVPLDGSKRAEAILPHVKDLAQRYGSEAILLRVIEPEPVVIAPEPIYTPADPEYYQERINEIKTYLASRQVELRKAGIKTQIVVGEGPVVDNIINVAENEHVDLIALASHGRTGLARVFYGSIAAGVLHRVDRPLFLIRAVDEEAP